MHIKRIPLLEKLITKLNKKEALTSEEQTHLTYLLQDLESEIDPNKFSGFEFVCQDILTAIIYIFNTYEINDHKILAQPKLLKLFMCCLKKAPQLELIDNELFDDYNWILSNNEQKWDYRLSLRPICSDLGYTYDVLFNYPPDRVLKVVINNVTGDYATLFELKNYKLFNGLGLTKVNKNGNLDIIKLANIKANELVKEVMKRLIELDRFYGHFFMNDIDFG